MQESHAALATPVITRSEHRRGLGVNNRGLIYRPTCRRPRTDSETWWRRPVVLVLGTAALLGLAACANTTSSTTSLQGKPLSGYVDMSQVQAAYIGSGSAGNGTLTYRGNTYPFTVGGLGVGGIGVSTIQAKGEVYGLRAPTRLPRRVRSGPLWLGPGQYKRRGPLAEERSRRGHAFGRQAQRADVEPGRRRSRDQHEPVTSSAGEWMVNVTATPPHSLHPIWLFVRASDSNRLHRGSAGVVPRCAHRQ
jgi:hypothetical protein